MMRQPPDAKKTRTAWRSGGSLPTIIGYDGDGRMIKRVNGYNQSINTSTDTHYLIRSSVLSGEVVSEITKTGAKMKTYVRANGTVVAEQYPSASPSYPDFVIWTHKDPSLASTRSTNKDGTSADWQYGDLGKPNEFNALGQEVGTANSYINGTPPPDDTGGTMLYGIPQFTQMINGSPTTFALDGIPVTRDMFMAHLMPMLNLYGGGMFGMIEISKRMSNKIIGTRTYTETYKVEKGYIENGVFFTTSTRFAQEIWSVPIYSQNWSINWSIFSFGQSSGLPEDIVTERVEVKSPDKATLKTKMSEKLTGDCKKFIDALTAHLKAQFPDVGQSKNGNLLDIFQDAKTVFLDPNPNDPTLGGIARGSFKGGDAEIQLLSKGTTTIYKKVPNWTKETLERANNKSMSSAIEGFVLSAIHEATHHLGFSRTFTDKEMAQAASTVGSSLTTEKLKPFLEGKDRDYYSMTYNNILDYFCKSDKGGSRAVAR